MEYDRAIIESFANKLDCKDVAQSNSTLSRKSFIIVHHFLAVQITVVTLARHSEASIEEVI